jgi:predicted nuclease of restriction endonuclease-like (RecB) superfamily
MKPDIIKNKDYAVWLKEIKAKIRNTQIKAAVRVNTELLNLYWDLGKMIVEKQSKAKWGDGVIELLSKDLLSEFPEMTGFSLTNLKYIRKWYQFYSRKISQQLVGQLGTISKTLQFSRQIQKSQQAVDQIQSTLKMQQLVGLIPWGNHIQIITKCKEPEEALFYVMENIKNNWSRSVLVHQMESGLYKRQGKAITNFEFTLPAPQSDLARETLKNSYNFDFLSLGKEMQERDLESALVHHLKKFMLELGKGYAYVGNQHNLTVENDDFFLDLLFYNYHLHCFVIVELKIGDFKAEYAGKLNLYINIVNAQLKGSEDKSTIGILLCKTPNKTIVKYSLQGISTPMGVSDYKLGQSLPKELKGEIPSIKELEQELKKETEELQKHKRKISAK